jgi:putative ubiquitin-RnfH superfamily antitoxin RatB of RatAB toxin-antitoxin module
MIEVTVAFSPAPRAVLEYTLQVPEGATVRQAVQASGLAAACPGLDLAACDAGIWGRRSDWETPLRERDRVEIYRPLRVDPKVARRERFRRQGARAAGLFAGKRPGKKAGY